MSADSIPAHPVPGDPPVFACTGVGHSYRDRYVALDEVSFTVAAGERVALLGANGCGKSTLLKALAGLLFPARGRIEAFGAELTEDALEDERFFREFRSRVGVVFQNADAQVFSASVREEVAFGPLQLGLPREEVRRRTDDVLELLGITALADRPPFQLSGGQKKRVAIAAVLAMSPRVVLFDEPTAALDPRSQQWLVELIDSLATAGTTIVLASHDLAMIDDIATRALVFGEDHRLHLDAPIGDALADRELLLRVNLIHPRTRLP